MTGSALMVEDRQPVREAVNDRGLFTVGWFGTREKHCSLLEIYDRLRASEQAEGRRRGRGAHRMQRRRRGPVGMHTAAQIETHSRRQANSCLRLQPAPAADEGGRTCSCSIDRVTRATNPSTTRLERASDDDVILEPNRIQRFPPALGGLVTPPCCLPHVTYFLPGTGGRRYYII